jgi:hypothetical protein
MALASAAVTVADSATALHTANTDPQFKCRVVAYNNDASVTMYVGSSAVTTSTGIPVAAGKSISLDLEPAEVAYAIVASGTLNARVLTSKV